MGLNLNKILVIALHAVVLSLLACGDGANDSNQSASSNTASQTQDARPFVMSNNFSDSEWKNGVLQKDGKTNVFYILQSEKEPLKVKAGDLLIFTKSGKETIQKVVHATTSQNGKISLFITLDKDIDPIADGYPNKIYLVQ